MPSGRWPAPPAVRAFAVGLGYASQQGLHEMHRRRVASLEELTKPCDRLEAGGGRRRTGIGHHLSLSDSGSGRWDRDPAGDRTAAPDPAVTYGGTGPGGLPYGGTHAVELAAACSSTAAGSARHELGATGEDGDRSNGRGDGDCASDPHAETHRSCEAPMCQLHDLAAARAADSLADGVGSGDRTRGDVHNDAGAWWAASLAPRRLR